MNAREFIMAHTQRGSAPLVPEISLRLGDSVLALWESLQREMGNSECSLPFWAFPWVGGQALARYILDHPEVIAVRQVLDFGTGSGICALAAALAGARHVLAVDVDPIACQAVALNAELARLAVEVQCVDLLHSAPPPVDAIIAGDLCYESPLAARLQPWLRSARASGVRVFIADPDRGYLPRRGVIPLERYDVPTSRDLEDADVKHTTVYELAGPSAPREIGPAEWSASAGPE